MKKLFLFISLIFITLYVKAQSDSSSFQGYIKYKITTDDPADHDSVFIFFSQYKIGVQLFVLGERGMSVESENMIADFHDSTLYVLDAHTKTYRKRPLFANPDEVSFDLTNSKKTSTIAGTLCTEFKGEMRDKNGSLGEAACLLSRTHDYFGTLDYNFLNSQPVIMAGRVVLGFRTKSPEGDNMYVIAYRIIPGNVDSYFDISGYKPK